MLRLYKRLFLYEFQPNCPFGIRGIWLAPKLTKTIVDAAAPRLSTSSLGAAIVPDGVYVRPPLRRPGIARTLDKDSRPADQKVRTLVNQALAPQG